MRLTATGKSTDRGGAGPFVLLQGRAHSVPTSFLPMFLTLAPTSCSYRFPTARKARNQAPKTMNFVGYSRHKYNGGQAKKAYKEIKMDAVNCFVFLTMSAGLGRGWVPASARTNQTMAVTCTVSSILSLTISKPLVSTSKVGFVAPGRFLKVLRNLILECLLDPSHHTVAATQL